MPLSVPYMLACLASAESELTSVMFQDRRETQTYPYSVFKIALGLAHNKQ